jgi:hypothetical protein
LKRIKLGLRSLFCTVDQLPKIALLLVGDVAHFTHQGLQNVLAAQVPDAKSLDCLGGVSGSRIDLGDERFDAIENFVCHRSAKISKLVIGR